MVRSSETPRIIQKDLLGNPIVLMGGSVSAPRGQGKFFRIPRESPPEKASSQEGRAGHPYWIPEGTAMWSGPYDKDGTQMLGPVPQRAFAKPLYGGVYHGFPWFRVVVESPRALKGKRFVIAKRPGQKGWIR